MDRQEWQTDFSYQPLLLGRDFFQLFRLRMEYHWNGPVKVTRTD